MINQLKLSAIVVFILMLIFSFRGSAQVTESQRGLLYDELTGKLYTGIFTEKYPDGQPKSQTAVVNGRRNGLSLLFHLNGIKSEVRMYKDNLMHGTWETWNEEGRKTAEANYANDRKNGKWYIWDNDGMLRYEMTYFDGDKSGIWTMWDEKGDISAQKDFSLNPTL